MTAKPKKSLIKAFAKAVAGIALGIALAYGGFIATFYAGRGEPLTPGEKTLVTNIFGNEIDASQIRKHFRDNSSPTHVMPGMQGTVLPFISHIDFFGEGVHSPDFSRESPNLYGFFAHEATHCWQNQTGNWTLKNPGIYEFTVTPTSRFSDFGMEQQADIIQAYADRFLNPEGRKSATAATADFDGMIQRVVEDRFPHARQTRLVLDAQDAAPATARPAPAPAPRSP